MVTGTAAALVLYSVAVNRGDRSSRSYVSRNAAVGACLVAAARRCGLPWEALGLSLHGVARGLRVGAPFAAVVVAATAVGGRAVGRHPAGRRRLGDRRATLSRRDLWWQTLVRIPFGTAAFEEVAFRGVLHGLAAHRHGPAVGMWVSSATFGLWHVPPTLAALRINDIDRGRVRACLTATALTTVAGLALGRLREAGGHVSTPWLVHATINASALVTAAMWQSARRS